MKSDNPIYEEIMSSGLKEPLDPALQKTLNSVASNVSNTRQSSIVGYLNDCHEHLQHISEQAGIPEDERGMPEDVSHMFTHVVCNPKHDDITRLTILHQGLSRMEDDMMVKAMQYSNPIEEYKRPDMPSNLVDILFQQAPSHIHPEDIANVELSTDISYKGKS